MSWIKRHIDQQLQHHLKKGKVLVVYGARRVGKTSAILNDLRNQADTFTGTGDDVDVRNILSSESLSVLNNAFKGYKTIFIDEAQRIPNIGWALKLLVDSNPDIQIIASGSSSFGLTSKLGEPLTGRQNLYTMFPISVSELMETYGGMYMVQNLNNLLVFGSYPETLLSDNDHQKQEYLLNLRNSYLFKDVLELEKIKSSQKIVDLLTLIAFQIGHEVSLSELSKSLGIAKQTVERYLDILEKAFIIIKVNGYSGNLRKEVTKVSRYYFVDNGVRNAVINNFNPPNMRSDMGMLWENFCFIERMKKQSYAPIFSNNYFWRTYDQQELDLLEARDGKLYGYEFKWNPRKKVKAPVAFANAYPNAEYECITPDNYLDFILFPIPTK